MELLTGMLQEESITPYELRFSIRIISRSIPNGLLWITDESGTIAYSTLGWEGRKIPADFEAALAAASAGGSGFRIGTLFGGEALSEQLLTYYRPIQLHGRTAVLFLHSPVMDIREAVKAAQLLIWLPLLFSLVAVGFILYSISRRLTVPLQQMNSAALALAEGDFSTRVPSSTEDEVGQLAASFNFMVEKLQDWEDTRQDFLAHVSHELRSPLTTLRGLIIGMNDGVIPPDKYAHYLRICDHEVQRLQRLVNDLLELARIQNGMDAYRIQPADLAALTRDNLALLAPALASKGIRLIDKVPAADGRMTVLADPDRYTQVLNNLVYNAIQFSPENGVVEVAMHRDERDVVIIVKDEGIGMTEEELKRIWDRFYKADESRSGSHAGTGLGLTIVRHLTQGMGGTVQAVSRKGEGSLFTVRFPRYQI